MFQSDFAIVSSSDGQDVIVGPLAAYVHIKAALAVSGKEFSDYTAEQLERFMDEYDASVGKK